MTPRFALLFAAMASATISTAPACASRPRATAESLLRAANAPAIVEGRVRDGEGRPVAGISVQGLPREKHLGWSPSAVTDGAGNFRLSLVAPGAYGFLLSWNGVTVVGPREDDPARFFVSLAPGERRTGVDLLFRREEWERALLSPRP